MYTCLAMILKQNLAFLTCAAFSYRLFFDVSIFLFQKNVCFNPLNRSPCLRQQLSWTPCSGPFAAIVTTGPSLCIFHDVCSFDIAQHSMKTSTG